MSYREVARCLRIVYVVVVASSVGLAIAGHAAASVRFHTSLPMAGPVLAGRSAAWIALGPYRRVTVLERDLATGQVATLLSHDSESGEDQLAALAGSPSALVVDISGADDLCLYERCSRDVFAGPPAGPLTPLESSCPANDPEVPEVDGSVVAYRDCSRGLKITDLRSGATVRREWRGRFFRIAGRYLAWAHEPATPSSAISVYDWKTDSLVYRLGRATYSDYPTDVAIGRDGTVVWQIYRGRERGRLAWASRHEPYAHLLPVPRRDVYRVRVARGKFAFEGGDEDGSIPHADVGVADRTGAVRVIAKGAAMDVFGHPFDFDGWRVAWSAYGCTGARIHVQSIHARPIRESLERCPLQFTRRPIVYRRRVRFEFSCVGYGFTCYGLDVSLRLSRDAYGEIGHGRNAEAVKLTPYGARLLKRRKRLRVYVQMTITDLLGARDRRGGVVTIVRPK